MIYVFFDMNKIFDSELPPPNLQGTIEEEEKGSVHGDESRSMQQQDLVNELNKKLEALMSKDKKSKKKSKKKGKKKKKASKV